MPWENGSSNFYERPQHAAAYANPLATLECVEIPAGLNPETGAGKQARQFRGRVFAQVKSVKHLFAAGLGILEGVKTFNQCLFPTAKQQAGNVLK